jgi:hypothetical protein
MVRAFRKTGGTPAKEIAEWKPTALRMRRRPKMMWEHDVKHDTKVIHIYQWKNQVKVGANGGGGGGGEGEEEEEDTPKTSTTVL